MNTGTVGTCFFNNEEVGTRMNIGITLASSASDCVTASDAGEFLSCSREKSGTLLYLRFFCKNKKYVKLDAVHKENEMLQKMEKLLVCYR